MGDKCAARHNQASPTTALTPLLRPGRSAHPRLDGTPDALRCGCTTEMLHALQRDKTLNGATPQHSDRMLNTHAIQTCT